MAVLSVLNNANIPTSGKDHSPAGKAETGFGNLQTRATANGCTVSESSPEDQAR